jgi:spoIIIJ-associated protein
VEWVETTGRTVEEAKEAALDQLGVDERDAEFEVLAEPRRGLFGIGGADARVRARVRPTVPRAKDDRRRRRERGRRRGDRPAAPERGPGRGEVEGEATAVATKPRSVPEPPRTVTAATPLAADRSDIDDDEDGGDDVDADLTIAEQAEVARVFVAGLVEAFGLSASVAASDDGDDTIDIGVTGDDLGVLIGPKGTTLQAIQELTRTAVQRRTPARVARLHVDVAGYRVKRREALERFTRQVAEQVVASGARRALEPMSAADRKIVHDTANLIDGVGTLSEGEEPRRRVVIVPASDTDRASE